MQNKINKSKEVAPKYMRICYKDNKDAVVDAVVRIPDYDYYEKMDYKDNMDRAINNIMDEGGFWLNDTTAIPSHRVLSFHTHQKEQVNHEEKATPEKKETPSPKKEPVNRNRGRRRRPKSKKHNENTVSTNNAVPQNSGSTGAGA